MAVRAPRACRARATGLVWASDLEPACRALCGGVTKPRTPAGNRGGGKRRGQSAGPSARMDGTAALGAAWIGWSGRQCCLSSLPCEEGRGGLASREGPACRLCGELSQHPLPTSLPAAFGLPRRREKTPVGHGSTGPQPHLHQHTQRRRSWVCAWTRPGRDPVGTPHTGHWGLGDGGHRAWPRHPTPGLPRCSLGQGLGPRGCWVAPGSLTAARSSAPRSQTTSEGPVPTAAQRWGTQEQPDGPDSRMRAQAPGGCG